MAKKIQLVIDKGDRAPDARTKAPADTIRVLENDGYTPWHITVDPAWSHVKKLFILCWSLFIFCLRIPRGSELFVQYPLTNLFWIFLPLLRLKRVHITMLVHDLETYRFSGTMDPKETAKFNCASTLILPSPTMEQLLRPTGLAVEDIRYHYLWPYLLPLERPIGTPQSPNIPRQIVFAGNLTKSAFLSQLSSLQNPNYTIKLYGGGYTPNLAIEGFVSYHGIFTPDTPTIEGDWGMVWEGNSLDACSGEIGDYLRMCASHKLSLYLAMGLPVIVWKEAAVAPFVENNNLGIALSNLYELEGRLSKMSVEEYSLIKQAVQQMSAKVRTGQLFITSLHP